MMNNVVLTINKNKINLRNARAQVLEDRHKPHKCIILKSGDFCLLPQFIPVCFFTQMNSFCGQNDKIFPRYQANQLNCIILLGFDLMWNLQKKQLLSHNYKILIRFSFLPRRWRVTFTCLHILFWRFAYMDCHQTIITLNAKYSRFFLFKK